MIISCPKCGGIFDTDKNHCANCGFQLSEPLLQQIAEVEAKKARVEKIRKRLRLSTVFLFVFLMLFPLLVSVVDIQKKVPVKTEPIVYKNFNKYSSEGSRCKFEVECDRVEELISVVTSYGTQLTNNQFLESSQGASTYYFSVKGDSGNSPVFKVVGSDSVEKFKEILENNDVYTFYGTREAVPNDIHPSGYGDFLYDPNDAWTIIEQEYIDSCTAVMKAGGVMEINLNPKMENIIYETKYTVGGIIIFVVGGLVFLGIMVFKIKCRRDLKKETNTVKKEQNI